MSGEALAHQMIAEAVRASLIPHMRRRAFNDPGHAHFLTFSCYHRRQFLTDDRVRTWLAESIDAARHKHDFGMWAYVFMPDHVHLLLYPHRNAYSISTILRDIKEPLAQRLVSYWRKEAPWHLDRMKARQGRREIHRLWQAGGGYDRNLTDPDTIGRAIDYIEWNPVRRGYVKEPSEWIWSSARSRLGVEDVPLRIDMLQAADVC